METTANTPTAHGAPAEDLDLSAHEDINASDLVLKNPATGAPTTSFVTIIGPEHPARKKLQFDRARRLRQEYAKRGKIEVKDPLEDVEDQTEFLVACTTGWSLKLDGQPFPFSAVNARILYTDPKRQWLRAQVLKGLEETERFISSSAKA